MPDRTIVLLGLRGAGKSAVARDLARSLGLEARDLDRDIEANAGKTIARIFAEDGEARFRDLEERALEEALSGKTAVLAPGGGVVLREKNRARLRSSGALLVYLKARPETLAARVEADLASKASRPPLVPGGALAESRALLAAREAFYLDLAALVVETDSLTTADVAARVVAARKNLTL